MWGKMKESDYKKRYYRELQSPVAHELMRHIVNESKERDVYIVSVLH